jgi:4-carboxymuconolactone decarboxylase
LFYARQAPPHLFNSTVDASQSTSYEELFDDMTYSWFLVLVLLGCIGVPTMAQDRMPEIPPDKMTESQKKAVDEFIAGRGSRPVGPFIPLLRSPEVMLRAKAMGDYLRFKSVLPPKLSELAILITAREWTQQFEWSVHAQIAIKAGVNPEIVKAISEGRRPAGLSDDESIIYDFCTELHHNKSVSDTVYTKALAKFGEQGIIDLVGINGYYTFLSMVMNVARTPPQKDSEFTLVALPH